MDKKVVTCIGLGVMGGAMAANLVNAGFQVNCVDPNPAAALALQKVGGVVFSSPADAAAGVHAALVMVNRPEQIEEALFGDKGLATALPSGAVVWIASTIGSEDMVSFARRLAELGLHAVDGPVSGGKTQAQAGTLTVIAGGSDEALKLVAPLMKACARHVFHVGGIGAGSTVKVVNNLLAASHVALTAEAVALAIRAGVDPQLMIDVVEHSSGSSNMFSKRAIRMATGEHSVHASIDTFLKDLKIALAAAAAHNVPVPIATTAHDVFSGAALAGLGSASDTKLIDFCLAKNGESTSNLEFS